MSKDKFIIMYRCEFIFKGKSFHASSPDGIHEFINGFWIDADCHFTKTGDCKYWIPPNAINYIAKDTHRSN